MLWENFEFYEKLGSGSYGQVYRTKYKLDDKIYAIKSLDKEFIQKVREKIVFEHNAFRIKK